MNYNLVSIRLSMTKCREFVNESRLETPTDKFRRGFICDCTVSDDIVKAAKGEILVSHSNEGGYDKQEQLGRLSQPELEDGRRHSAYPEAPQNRKV